jgi:hypothetical protein
VLVAEIMRSEQSRSQVIRTAVDAVMEAAQVAATVAAPAVDLTAQHVVSAVVVGMAADTAN